MKKAYFSIDGFSFRRISDYYKTEHRKHSRLSLKAFEIYLRYEIGRRLDIKSDCESLNIEKHFYHPGENPRNIFDPRVKDRAFKFEDNLTEANYNVHYIKESSNISSPNMDLYTDIVLSAENWKYDIFVLLSTQREFAELFKYLRNRKVTTMLIGWDGACKNSKGQNRHWQTDKTLKNYANAYCPLEKILEQTDSKHPFAEIMFEKNFRSFHRKPFSPRSLLTQQCG